MASDATPPHDLNPLLQEAERVGFTLSDEQVTAFDRYLAAVMAENQATGLTSLSDPADVLRRHFAESLALLAALRAVGVVQPGSAARVADLGPGGGFPGLPMRIAEPGLRLTLIESHGRRAEFLRRTVDALDLDGVEVVEARAEDAGRNAVLRGTFDLVVARALAPLRVLVEYALPLLHDGGVLATPKGSRWEQELGEARHAIEELRGEALPSVILPQPAGVPEQRVLLVRQAGAVPDRYPRRAGIPSKRPL